jgi:hypothetical protein
MTTPTWNNAPLFSDLRIEERVHNAKKAHNNSMFPTYAGHSGIEKSRKDRKTLTHRKLPLFLKKKADWEKKMNQKRLQVEQPNRLFSSIGLEKMGDGIARPFPGLLHGAGVTSVLSATNMLLTRTQMDQIILLGEGNRGALSILGTIALESQGRPRTAEYYFDALARVGVKGSQIWVLYKDECNQDMDRFRERIENL